MSCSKGPPQFHFLFMRNITEKYSTESMNATLFKIKARKGCFCSDSIEEPYFLASQETFQ